METFAQSMRVFVHYHQSRASVKAVKDDEDEFNTQYNCFKDLQNQYQERKQIEYEARKAKMR